MNKYTKEELENALKVVSSTIDKCEKIHPKFAEGTSQHTLLKNRIKAMYISKSLLTKNNDIENYTKEELEKAMPPVTSIIKKCEKAIQKFDEGNSNYKRFKNIIDAMYISKALIEAKIELK